MVTLSLMWAAHALAHDGPQQLDRLVRLRVPAPIASVYEGEEEICTTIRPTLQTPAIEFDEGDYGALCESDVQRTRACLIVRPGAAWPKRFPELVCEGDGHTLRIEWVAGWDPYEDLSDGVRIVRMRGPDDLTKTHFATFAAPGWPDSYGILAGGECGVRDERLVITFRQDDDVMQRTCILAEPVAGGIVEREVPIRLVNRLKTAD